MTTVHEHLREHSVPGALGKQAGAFEQSWSYRSRCHGHEGCSASLAVDHVDSDDDDESKKEIEMGVFMSLVILAVGLFAFAGGAFNWEWFMNDNKARFMTSLLGRTVSRVFYVLMGLAISGVGVASLVSSIDLSH